MQLLPLPKKLSYKAGHLQNASAEPNVTISDSCQKNEYTLSVTPDGIEITASNNAAAFHARQTLSQIRTQYSQGLPCLEIEDWPDLEIRGYMLDISRCKVPTKKSLFELIDLLASLKYNQLQLYTEHTFAYRNHEKVWRDASPLDPNDILELQKYCKDRYIELVPNQNSFGHMERWLRHPEYQHLAESPNGFEHPLAGWKEFGSTLKPTADSVEFVDSLFSELLPNFDSKSFNIGGDEPWELGQGYSRELVKLKGKTRVYLDHLLRIQEKVQDHGREIQFWGDIIINDPDLAKELDSNATALLWGYEVDHPFSDHCQAMQRAGAKFYVVPGTSTWNSIGGRLYTALPNIDSAASNAHEFGADGMLLTDWGDNGHHQSSLFSVLPIIQAAERSWNKTVDAVDLDFVSTHLAPNPLAPKDVSAIRELSAVAEHFETYLHNGNWLNKILFATSSQAEELIPKLSLTELTVAEDRLKAINTKGELELARKLLLHATEKGLALVGRRTVKPIPIELLEEYRLRWLSKNREGGLEESVSYFMKAL